MAGTEGELKPTIAQTGLGAAILLAMLLAVHLGPLRAESSERAAKPTSPPAGAPLARSGTLKKISSSGVVTIGYREASFPFSYIRDDRPPLGYSIDLCLGIVDEIKRELGGISISVAYRLVTSDTRLDAVQSGEVDLECGSTTRNKERQKYVAFSPVIFVAGTKLLVRRSSGIASYQDLSGKTLVVTSGTTNAVAMYQLNDKYKLGITIMEGDDHQQSLDMFISGKAVAFATDDVLLQGFVSAYKAGATLAVVGDYITYEPYAIMFRKDDPAMAEAVARAFATMARTGLLLSTYRKWFLQPTPTGEFLNMPLSLPLTESLRALGIDQF
jgi:glutamate/aspartate transport system substrate-binding protein